MYVSFFICMSRLTVRTQSHLHKHETTHSFFSIHVCLVSYVYVSSKSVHSIAPIKAPNYTLVSFPCVVLIGLFFISQIDLVFIHVSCDSVYSCLQVSFRICMSLLTVRTQSHLQSHYTTHSLIFPVSCV